MVRPAIPLTPKSSTGASGTVSLDTSGLEAKLGEITAQLQVLAAATNVESFESIIADLNAQVSNLQAQLNNVNSSRNNLRELLLQIDGLIDEDNI